MIVVNGDPRDFAPGQTVVGVLGLLGLSSETRGVAVALDGEVVPRAGWREVEIPDGAHVEVLTAMQGG